MINQISESFHTSNNVDFIQDDDVTMQWLSEFDSSRFERFIVFIDSHVSSSWGETVLQQLEAHQKEIIIKEIEPFETSKTITFYPEVIGFLEDVGSTRFDLVIAIGGGIVLDMAGFVVSTYMRGLPLMMIPTTLIGQTDASTAGKTCFNSHESKNLLGTFYFPEVVYNNIHFLISNPGRIFRQGLSESFKYGLLNSNQLVKTLSLYRDTPNSEILKKIINLTIKSRIAIRKIDPLASNLGHTFGHAIEKASNYEILHGDAIAAGTVLALGFAVKKKIMKDKRKEEIISMMKFLGLNLYIDKEIDATALVSTYAER